MIVSRGAATPLALSVTEASGHTVSGPTNCAIPSRRGAGASSRKLRRPLRHLDGTGSQAAVVRLPQEACLSVAARSRGGPPLARFIARPHDAGDGRSRSQRPPPLGTGGVSISIAP